MVVKMRVMWLLNHRTARRYDLEMLRQLGLNEVFLPKSFPAEESYASGDVTYEWDDSLSIPAADLAILNAANWYDPSDPVVWDIANRHFQVAICGIFPNQLGHVAHYFRGATILRSFGLSAGVTYNNVIYEYFGPIGANRIRELGNRFWFGQAYPHLHEVENEFIRDRRCYLPLGLLDAKINDQWLGTDSRMMFVCPRIETNPYYKQVYNDFLRDFKDLPYAVLGAQPIKVSDRNVLGYSEPAVYAAHMKNFRLMYYHSTEPYHVHYHPFEAVRAGLPLVFLAGGMLDKLGGGSLPGRCKTVKEARRKVERLLGGDRRLAEQIREAQPRLLDHMRPEYGAPIWKQNFPKILLSAKNTAAVAAEPRKQRQPAIAVILPIEYRGGTLRAAKLIAAALHDGSRRANEPVRVVLAHPDNPERYPDAEFHDLAPDITRRPFTWRTIDRIAAERICQFSGYSGPLNHTKYAVADDGINNFLDCDLWLVISDRLELPLLPLKPCALVVYDYIQRYQPTMNDDADLAFLYAARAASAVLVTSHFTNDDAIQYAGINPKLLRVVPHLLPHISPPASTLNGCSGYFLWPTNISIHKNHVNSMLALRRYYEELQGKLKCRLTGVQPQFMLSTDHSYRHLQRAKEIFDSSRTLKRNVTLMGELPDGAYDKNLAEAHFLWHTASVDNGTLAALEAASLGVPILSTRYPAMQQMNSDYNLRIAWCDPNDPAQMAIALKRMETEAPLVREALPNRQALKLKGWDNAISSYWHAIRECL